MMFLIYLAIYVAFGVGYVVPRTDWSREEHWYQAAWEGLKISFILVGWFLIACAEFLGLIQFKKGESDDYDNY